MRVIIAYGPSADPVALRQVVLGAGLDCASRDCVSLKQLESRLSRGSVDLLIVATSDGSQEAAATIQEVARVASFPILAVGPSENSDWVARALESGAEKHLDMKHFREELDVALDELSRMGADPRKRGLIVSVFAPTPGSGATTVASNLAGVMARAYPGDVALVSLTRQDDTLAVLLDFTPKHTVDEVCRRWDRLDATSLRNSLFPHKSGVSVLAHGFGNVENGSICSESVHRLAVLLRTMFRFTVFELDSRLEDEQLEAMKVSDVVGLVVRPDVPTVLRAGRALTSAAANGVSKDRFRLVVNRWGQAGQLSLKHLQESLHLKPLLLIPDDPKKDNKAANRGLLLQELSKHAVITRRFAALATELTS